MRMIMLKSRRLSQKLLITIDQTLGISTLDETVMDWLFTTKNQNKQSNTNNFVIFFNFIKCHTWKRIFIWLTQERLVLHLVEIW